MQRLEYQTGQSLNIGLSFTSLNDPVDVSTAEDIVVSIVSRAMMKTKLEFKKSDGTLVIDKNKGLITVNSTDDMVGEYYISIKVITTGYTRAAMLDKSIYFKRINA